MSMGISEHYGQLQVIGDDGAVNLHEHGIVHLYPFRMVDVGHVDEDMIGEGVLVEDDKEYATPMAVVVGHPI